MSNQDSLVENAELLYTTCVTMINTNVAILSNIKNRELMKFSNLEEVTNYVKLLERDVHNFRLELNKIRRTVPDELDVNNLRDLQKSMSIGMKYNDWQARFDRVIQPTVQRLSQLFLEAEQNMKTAGTTS